MTDGPVKDDPTPADERARSDAGDDLGVDRDPDADAASDRHAPSEPDTESESGVDTDAEPVTVEEILVPVDGSEESMTAMEYAVAIAQRYDGRVHALYVLDEELVRETAAGTIDDADVAARGEGFMDAARECAPADVSLTHSTAYGFSPTQKSRHPGSVIVDAAEAAAVDFIVIPREPGGAGQDETLSRAAEYVLQYADQPVLST